MSSAEATTLNFRLGKFPFPELHSAANKGRTGGDAERGIIFFSFWLGATFAPKKKVFSRNSPTRNSTTPFRTHLRTANWGPASCVARLQLTDFASAPRNDSPSHRASITCCMILDDEQLAITNLNRSPVVLTTQGGNPPPPILVSSRFGCCDHPRLFLPSSSFPTHRDTPIDHVLLRQLAMAACRWWTGHLGPSDPPSGSLWYSLYPHTLDIPWLDAQGLTGSVKPQAPAPRFLVMNPPLLSINLRVRPISQTALFNLGRREERFSPRSPTPWNPTRFPERRGTPRDTWIKMAS